MVLSRIWASFVIIAVIVAGIKMFGGDKTIFNRMVVGKSKDPYDTVYYYTIDSAVSQKLSRDYPKFLKEYGYARSDSAQKATVLLTSRMDHDSVNIVKALNPNIKVYTYLSVQSKLERKSD